MLFRSTELVCQFKKVKRLSGGAAPTDAIASVKTVRVPSGSATLTVS